MLSEQPQHPLQDLLPFNQDPQPQLLQHLTLATPFVVLELIGNQLLPCVFLESLEDQQSPLQLPLHLPQQVLEAVLVDLPGMELDVLLTEDSETVQLVAIGMVTPALPQAVDLLIYASAVNIGMDLLAPTSLELDLKHAIQDIIISNQARAVSSKCDRIHIDLL